MVILSYYGKKTGNSMVILSYYGKKTGNLTVLPLPSIPIRCKTVPVNTFHGNPLLLRITAKTEPVRYGYGIRTTTTVSLCMLSLLMVLRPILTLYRQ